jgi:hypothetical protein
MGSIPEEVLFFFFNLPNPSCRTRPLVPEEKCIWGVERGRCVRLTTLPPSVSLFSRHCEILNVSRPYRPPRPDKGIASLFIIIIVEAVFIAPSLRVIVGVGRPCELYPVSLLFVKSGHPSPFVLGANPWSRMDEGRCSATGGWLPYSLE